MGGVGYRCKCNFYFILTKHQKALGAPSKVFMRFGSNWNLEMLVFVEEGKLENPWSKEETQQQTQPTYDAKSGNRTWATLVGDKC